MDRRKDKDYNEKIYKTIIDGMYIWYFVVWMWKGRKNKNKNNEDKEATALTIYEQLEIQKDPLSDTDVETVQKGVNEWVKAFLAVNSDAKDKEITDDDLYQNIANEEQRNKLKEEREAFYKDSTVEIGECLQRVRIQKKQNTTTEK